LFFIYETAFYIYMVKGQTINNEKSDCVKIYNYLKGDSKEQYNNNCCTEYALAVISCDTEGCIKHFSNIFQRNFFFI